MSYIKNISRGCCFSRGEDGEFKASHRVGCQKLEVNDWIGDTPNPLVDNRVIEVQFKNTRKAFYEVVDGTVYAKGDIVVVESTPGVDVGVVSICGELVTRQMKRSNFNPVGVEFRKVLRKAKSQDIEKWQESISLEYNTMIRSRQIAASLGLKMKIGDVEYQGDKLKAIFYYIADERVDFRELIKIFAEQFRIRVEMRQIGARQEAGRIGGISACGRELCCSTWQNSFQSVTIGAARHQEISLNPQKLAGQCGKLKCCLNYEVDSYIDARRDFPRLNGPLEAMDGLYYLVKSDIFKKVMWFSPDQNSAAIMIPVSIDRVRKIISMNRKGVKVDKLEDVSLIKDTPVEPEFINVVGEESITRFDRGGNKSRNRKPRNAKSDKLEKSDRADRPERGEKPERADRPERPERSERSNNAKQESQSDEQRSSENRPQRPQRPNRDNNRDNRGNRDGRDNNREPRESQEASSEGGESKPRSNNNRNRFRPRKPQQQQ